MTAPDREPTAPGQGGSRPVAVTLPEVQELAAAWAVDLSTLAAEMYEFLAARIRRRAPTRRSRG